MLMSTLRSAGVSPRARRRPAICWARVALMNGPRLRQRAVERVAATTVSPAGVDADPGAAAGARAGTEADASAGGVDAVGGVEGAGDVGDADSAPPLSSPLLPPAPGCTSARVGRDWAGAAGADADAPGESIQRAQPKNTMLSSS